MNSTPPRPGLTVSLQEEKNPFFSLDPMPRISPLTTVLLALLVSACAVYQPYCFGVPAVGALLLCVILGYFLIVARTPFALLSGFAVFVLGDLAGLLIFPEHPAAFGIWALAELCVVGVGASLICASRSRFLLIIPAAVFGISFLICRDASLAVLSLAAMPAAGILAFATCRNRPRVSAICMTSGIVGICAVFALCLLWYRRNGTIVLSDVADAINRFRTSILDTLHAAFEGQKELYPDLFGDIGYDPVALIEPLIHTIFNLLPALFIFAVNLLSYAAQNVCVLSFAGLKIPAFITRSARIFLVSTPTAVIYLIACLLSLFAGDTLFGAVVSNLRLILLPGLSIVGFWKLIADIRVRRTSRGFFLFLILATLILPGVTFLCLSISGAIATILRPILIRIITEGKLPPNNSGHDDNDPPSSDAP